MVKKSKDNKPITVNEDVEFSLDRADGDDLNALERARKADERAKGSE
ncbi:YfhD family protein [Vulcanibacillus modesticaldus]|nr:YfhD family protein [Vulcanibacillus modesticaldus]